MKLKSEPFNKIKNGMKTIELRLYDEKRQQIKTGDFIEFSLIDDPDEKIQTRVVDLHRFNNFKELYSDLPKNKLGYSDNEVPDPDHMNDYYSYEQENKYGVLGIEIRFVDLQKFIDAQDYGYSFGKTYQTAFEEMKKGRKITHWIWYVFPQIQGLGFSDTTAYFSIKNLQEAIDYYEHPILGKRLTEITETLINIESDDPMNVFGYPDAYKLRSCMTLFNHAAPECDLFQKVLDKYCQGMEDYKTTEKI